jgi:Mg-chelatase subunit ChlD
MTLAPKGLGRSGIQELSEAELSKLDFALVIDHSGSMGASSLRISGSRYQEVQEDAVAIARIASQYDGDGITVIPFSTSVRVYDEVTESKVENVFRENVPRGSTNLSSALKEVYYKARTSEKDMVAIVYTDGMPDNQTACVDAMTAIARELGRPKIGFAIIQVGTDQGASKFLDHLDHSLRNAPDVVACLKAEQAEGLSFGQICWLARNA